MQKLERQPSRAAAILIRARWFLSNISAKKSPQIMNHVPFFSARLGGSTELGARRIHRVSAELRPF